MDPIGSNFTSYQDLKGEMIMDFQGDQKTDFKVYAESLGIDTKLFNPFGIEVACCDAQGLIHENTEVRILAYNLQNQNDIVRFRNADSLTHFFTNMHRLSILIIDKYQNISDLNGCLPSSEIDLGNSEV